jgi:C4-dicarboxylate transporter, DctQ subunit
LAILKWLERYFEELICCSALVIIALCVFSQVVARYVFSVAIHWTEEVAAISMVWAVYMGAALCVRERFHIRILVGVTSLPERLGKNVIFISDLFWAFFCVFMIKVGWDYLAVFWKFTSRSPSLGIDELYPQSILIIGYSLMLVRLIQTYVHWIRDGRHGLPGRLVENGSDPIDDQEQQV